ALVSGRPLRPFAARRLPAHSSRNQHFLRRAIRSHLAPARYRRLSCSDVLAERVFPDSRTTPPHTLRRRSHRQRIAVPIPVLNGRTRSAPVLSMNKASVTGTAQSAVLYLGENLS